MIQSTDAYQLFINQRRFDLIFKYLYAKCPDAIHRAMYIEHLRALNGFHEMNPTDGPKESPEDFLSAFDKLIQSLKTEGYKETYAPIPIGPNGEIQDGAHRLSACAALGMSVPVEGTELNYLYDYRHFIFKKAPRDLMDYGALEYVKLNPHAYFANLQPVTNPKDDDKVEAILNKYGFVFYKKVVRVTNGRYPMRVFVFVCDEIDNVQAAKAEIQDVYHIGNTAVYINDSHEEAIQSAENYFNTNIENHREEETPKENITKLRLKQNKYTRPFVRLYKKIRDRVLR